MSHFYIQQALPARSSTGKGFCCRGVLPSWGLVPLCFFKEIRIQKGVLSLFLRERLGLKAFLSYKLKEGGEDQPTQKMTVRWSVIEFKTESDLPISPCWPFFWSGALCQMPKGGKNPAYFVAEQWERQIKSAVWERVCEWGAYTKPSVFRIWSGKREIWIDYNIPEGSMKKSVLNKILGILVEIRSFWGTTAPMNSPFLFPFIYI